MTIDFFDAMFERLTPSKDNEFERSQMIEWLTLCTIIGSCDAPLWGRIGIGEASTCCLVSD